jgi:predicted transcriptional regulator
VSYSSPKGLRELVDTAAEAAGCNRSAWIVVALQDRLAREGWWVDAATGEHFREEGVAPQLMGSSGNLPEGATRLPVLEAAPEEPKQVKQFAAGGKVDDWRAAAAGIDWEDDDQ